VLNRPTHGARLEEISFDLYERYILLEHIGSFFRPPGSGYAVLDVGGHTSAFWPGFPSLAGDLIPEATVSVVDMIPAADLRNYIRASGVQLPFRDGAFDLVCSLDTLEHIPDELRPAFLSELLRVTRDGLYLAFPFDSASNRWAESVVVEYADVVLKTPIPALLEHRQFGLPDRESIARLFSTGAYPWIGFAQGNTDVWLLMMLTYHSLRMPGTDFVRELNGRFNRAYAAQDWAEPHYRAGYLLSKRRSVADLETLRASFGSAGKQADLQSVLAFCQLFLTIAQNGRALADKDRHIRNIEADLAAARAAEEKRGELEESLSRMTSLLGTIRERIEGLQSGREFQARLDGRMRDLEIGLVNNKRAIQAIYDSRIWKAFCSLGALLLRLTGRRAEPDRARPWPNREPVVDSVPSSRAGAGDEFVGMTCDYPGNVQILPVRDVVEIRGWAIARSGIDRVLIRIGDDAPVSAFYGIPRPDVARSHPEFIDAGQSGYRYFWDTAGLPEGLSTVRVTAVARNGQTREVVCRVRIDFRTPPDYGLWIARSEPSADALRQMRLDTGSFAVRPRISICVPVYKTSRALLTRCIESVMDQTYSNWELCLVDDGSADADLTALLQKFAQCDSRIRVAALKQNRGIAAATNEALRLSSGEYVAFLDHDDELAGFALSEVVKAINDSPDTDLFYSDEDKIDEQGRRYDAFFKPGWSPDLFRSCNYICHFVVMKRTLLERLGGLNESYSGSQDYEFLLRANELTQKVARIPKILYHWRAVPGSAAKSSSEKPEASRDGERALTAYLARTAPGAQVEEVGACRYRVRYPISGNPRVSILIPTGGHKSVFRAVDDVLEKTSYKNYEILLIDNSRATRVEEYAFRLAARKAPVQYVDWRGKPFNFAYMNNTAARMTVSPYLLFLNDDTAIIAGDWLSAMLEHAQRPEVGAVGAQLWYPNDLIQHAGVVMGIFANCSHAFKGLPGGVPHYFDFPNLIRNCSAVTGACLMVGRDKFFEAGAFDEANLAVAFQDVDLCLKLLELGYRNVYTPYARLYHYESATKTEKDKIPDPAEDVFMKKKWARYIADDPYYNPNLTRRKEDFSLAID
jgi:glycosyltransferase involved in cell wall biosynthesis